ncbi:DUF2796 domain-containing protein [Aestuariibius sp. HNIBRBA575]|uniref:zinc uptake protein ZrgA n=1 Tax=Aestuariibius sp. HNIBRBA575 TaxID=3233343 RepID=UPI0034A12752
MKRLPFLALSVSCATPIWAEETRQLDAHEHGVGQLLIAVEGTQIAMELHAPGADIVGFEYAAQSDEDHHKIETAISALSDPLALIGVPDAAGCAADHIDAGLVGDGHDDHDDHDEHADHDDHDDHEDHDDHDDHDEHAEHDDHDDHKEHSEETGHTEFHAEYVLECADVAQISELTFPYFEAFPNSKELEIQILSDKGATSFEVMRDAPTLDVSSLF